MSLKNHLKTIALLLLASTLICSILFVPGILGFKSGVTAGGANYGVFEGVAGNDHYDSMQYSYQVNEWYHDNVNNAYVYTPANDTFNASKSLRVGMTDHGEIATPQYAGIAYGANATEWNATESWAPQNANIPSQYWVQGWVLYINYTRSGKFGGTNGLRCLLAWGLYSDLTTTEAGRNVTTWNGNYNSNEVGASLTTGSMTSSGMYVLYDSARLVVARATVTIHDNVNSEDVCQITFTLVFNKDSKYALVYKDYKTLLSDKVLQQINDFAFSERYELDMCVGLNPTDYSFIHYYHNVNSTVYQHPVTGDQSYDALQAFDPAGQYIFFAGYWPNATEYSVYQPGSIVPAPDLQGVPAPSTTVLPLGTAISDIPMPPGEPRIPWVVVQWRYNITNHPNIMTWLVSGGSAGASAREVRFVEVIGMTDYNHDPYPALDLNATGNYAVYGGANRLDMEVRYLLYHEVFNPEDLTTLDFNSNAYKRFMWVGLGQSAATTDSGGATMMSQLDNGWLYTPLTLFDRNDSLFPWTWSGGVGMAGTIPYGLNEWGGNYYETFSNSGKGTGTDTTSYVRTTLMGFAFGIYDNETEANPQPIAGGYSQPTEDWWYPSKDPLTERWLDATSISVYRSVTYHPNGIITLGGMKANGLTRYFNDFGYAISREGMASTYYALISGSGVITGSAPTSNFALQTLDYYPISTWNSALTTFGYTADYAVISLARDINGTRGLAVYGWNGRDTYWASAWASQYLATDASWLPAGTVSLILHITYSDASHEPTGFTIVKALGTITEFGTDAFYTSFGSFDPTHPAWTANLSGVPSTPSVTLVWWCQKLPTVSLAKVDFDT